MHSSKANYVLENFDHKLGLQKAPPFTAGSRESNLWMKSLRPRCIYTLFHNLNSKKAQLNILAFLLFLNQRSENG